MVSMGGKEEEEAWQSGLGIPEGEGREASELSKGGGGKRAWDRARASDLCSMQIPFDRSV